MMPWKLGGRLLLTAWAVLAPLSADADGDHARAAREGEEMSEPGSAFVRVKKTLDELAAAHKVSPAAFRSSSKNWVGYGKLDAGGVMHLTLPRRAGEPIGDDPVQCVLHFTQGGMDEVQGSAMLFVKILYPIGAHTSFDGMRILVDPTQCGGGCADALPPVYVDRLDETTLRFHRDWRQSLEGFIALIHWAAILRGGDPYATLARWAERPELPIKLGLASWVDQMRNPEARAHLEAAIAAR